MVFSESLRRLKEVLEDFSTDSQEIFVEALYLGFDNNYSEAIEAIDEALEVSGRFEKEGKSLLWSFKALALEKLHRDEEALVAINKAIEFDVNSSFSWALKGDFHHNLDQQEEALDAYEKALEKAEKNDEPEIIWNKADVLGHLGKHKEALEEYRKTIKTDPESPSVWFGISDELSELGKTEEAFEACEKGLEFDRDDTDLLVHHGFLLMDLDRDEDALKSLTRATSLNPKDELAWWNKTCALARLDRKEDALDALTVTVGLDPESQEAMKHEEDFENIRDTERFNRLLHQGV